ncbi:MAG: hypothetical protein ABFS37_05035, partial [Acidobacteriota bacterium]
PFAKTRSSRCGRGRPRSHRQSQQTAFLLFWRFPSFCKRLSYQLSLLQKATRREATKRHEKAQKEAPPKRRYLNHKDTKVTKGFIYITFFVLFGPSWFNLLC